MTPDDKPRFIETLTALAATFGKEADKPMLLGYWLGLRDLGLDAFLRAAETALKEWRVMPSVAVLRDLTGEMRSEDRVQLAWEAMVAAIRDVGGYRSITFEDPAITATVRALGGWERICTTDTEELHKWLRKDFERVYPAFARKPRPVERIAGLHEIANAGRPGAMLEHATVPAPYLTHEEQAQIERAARGLIAQEGGDAVKQERVL